MIGQGGLDNLQSITQEGENLIHPSGFTFQMDQILTFPCDGWNIIHIGEVGCSNVGRCIMWRTTSRAFQF